MYHKIDVDFWRGRGLALSTLGNKITEIRKQEPPNLFSSFHQKVHLFLFIRMHPPPMCGFTRPAGELGSVLTGNFPLPIS